MTRCGGLPHIFALRVRALDEAVDRRAFARIANALGARVGRSGPGATRAESAARSGM